MSVMQSELEEGYSLLQDVKTRFWTTYTVVERLVKAGQAVVDIFNVSDKKPPAVYLEKILKSFDSETEKCLTLPALNAIVTVFESSVTVQRKLEADKYPTMHLVLSYFQQIRDDLAFMEVDTSGGTSFSRKMANFLLKEFSSHNDHPLHAAAKMLVSKLQNLSL